MNTEQINPFLEATCQVFRTMLQCEPEKKKLRLPIEQDHDLAHTAIIGLSGSIRGAVALSFPEDTAKNIGKRFVQIDELTKEEMMDALGEVANMVAGSAKARFEGHEISIGLPTVVSGQEYWLAHPKDSVTLVVPYQSELGDFTLNVTLSTLVKAKTQSIGATS